MQFLKYIIEVIYQIKAPYLTSGDKPLKGLPWERNNDQLYKNFTK